MKTGIAVILMILLMIPLSSCSLLESGTAAGTQPEVSQQASGTQEGTGGADRSNSAEEASTASALPAETAANAKMVKVVLFFATEDNSALKQEEREIQVVDGAILKACIKALMEGPGTQGLRKTIPEGTILKGISIREKVATVDFSAEFGQAGGTAGTIARTSVVNTLTGINGVEKVRFHINGEEMIGPSGTPLGEITPVKLNADGTLVSD